MAGIPTTECLKVASLRKKYGSQINLENWIANPNNLYVGRYGRIFITDPTTGEKRIFHYSGSKWQNPYKVGKVGKDHYSLDESLNLYREYLIQTNLVKDIGELSGKNLGCFCDQAGPCHAKILVEYYCHALNMMR